MPRSHKSHKSHKHSSRDGRDRSDSEDDRNPRERKPRGEESAAGSGPRVSRDVEPEKRKSSSLSQPSHDKDLKGSSNGDSSGEHKKKRKDRVEDLVVGDRWSGGSKDDLVDKKAKREALEPANLDKTAKSMLTDTDPKGRSGRRREASSERNEESGSRVESAKRRSEKDSSRRDSAIQYKDVKERDRDYCKDAREMDRDHSKDASERERDYCKDVKERDRERGSERDKKVQGVRHGRSDDVVSRKRGSKVSSSEEEVVIRKDREITERQIQDDLRNPELEKELDKRIRRDRSGDKEKCSGDRDSGDKRLSSRDEHTKIGSSKDENRKEGRYRDKYRDDFDRDQRHRDDKARDEGFSRDHNSSRSDSKHFRDENKPSESRYKKSKLQGSDHDSSPYVDDHSTKLKDNRGRKRYYDETDDNIDLKHRNMKESHEDAEKNASCTSKFDSHADRARLDYLHSDKVVSKVDSSLGSNQPKNSPNSSNHAVKDQSRTSSNQAGASCRKSLSEDTLRPSTASRGDHGTVSGFRERASESRSLEKTKTKEGFRSDELIIEMAAPRQERTPKSDSHTSRNPVVEKSPSLSDRRFSDRTGARHSLDIEEPKSSSSKDGRDYSNIKDRERALPLEKSISDALSQAELLNNDPVSVGPSSSNRPGHVSGNSPNLLPPPLLGLYEDDNRVQFEDRKANSWYKRSNDHSMGRGQGNAWKGAPTWPSPVANGFIPLQHGPPPPRFHPAIQQFRTPPLFGGRPSMDLSNTRVPYNLREVADRFSGHGSPFGWHNPVDDYRHLQAWDGSNGAYGDESHVYGRPEWNMNRHLMGSRGWDMSADMWKVQNGNINMELPVHHESEDSARALSDKACVGQSGNQYRSELARLEHLPAAKSEIKRSNDTSPEKNVVETPQKSLLGKTSEPSKTPSDDNNVWFCCNYLSKLDISLELVHPELYKQCMSLLETIDMTSEYNVSKSKHPQNNKEVTRMAAKNTNHISSPLFPTRSDAVFQRAMSLYKKQNEGRKVMFPVPSSVFSEERDSVEASEAQKMEGVVCSEEKDSSEASEGQKMEGVVCSEEKDSSEASEGKKMEGDVCSEEKDSSEASEAQGLEAVRSEEKDSSEASESQEMEGIVYSEEKDSSEASEELKMEGVDTLISSDASLVVEVKAADTRTSVDSSLGTGEERNATTEGGCYHGDVKEQEEEEEEEGSDRISDTHRFVEVSQSSGEGLMGECKVNLSRIPLSPGSTH